MPLEVAHHSALDHKSFNGASNPTHLRLSHRRQRRQLFTTAPSIDVPLVNESEVDTVLSHSQHPASSNKISYHIRMYQLSLRSSPTSSSIRTPLFKTPSTKSALSGPTQDDTTTTTITRPKMPSNNSSQWNSLSWGGAAAAGLYTGYGAPNGPAGTIFSHPSLFLPPSIPSSSNLVLI